MPTYVYRREDGTTFEIDQSIKDDALTVCPTTGQRVTRVITGGPGLIFKGSGFYLTDYARKQGGGGDPTKPGSSSASDAQSGGGDGKTGGSEGATSQSDKKKTDGKASD